jgi:hypothetical protein
VASRRRIKRIVHNRSAGTLTLQWDDETSETIPGDVAEADRYAREYNLFYGGMDEDSNGSWARPARPRVCAASAEHREGA